MPNLLSKMAVTALVSIFVVVTLSSCSSLLGKNDKEARVIKNNIDLALGYLKRGQYDVSNQKINRALDADWENSEAHTVAALLAERQKRTEKAEEHYRYAIEFQPDDGSVLNNYGVFLCRQGKPQKAVELFMKAVNIPSYVTPNEAYENAGACARQIPDLKNAEKYLRIALSGNPKLPNALYEMAQISYGQKKNLSVRAYLQRFAAVASHTPQSLWLGVRAEKNLGDRQASEVYAKKLQRLFPDSEEFTKLLALPEDKTSRTGS